MPDYVKIYQTDAERYDRLVSREDYEGNLVQALLQIRPLNNSTIVEFGAGTGRITSIMSHYGKHVFAFDNSLHMLKKATAKLTKQANSNWGLAVADNRLISLPDGIADVAIAGWSFGHSVSWHPNSWKDKIGQMLSEMRRILKPGGVMVIIETLGTGRETPLPPSLHLERYYRWLETEHHFNPTWIRSDYLFHSVEEAAELCGFFFGENMARDILEKELQILPECTGIWWKTV